jgi:hypothetical protein
MIVFSTDAGFHYAGDGRVSVSSMGDANFCREYANFVVFDMDND